MDPARLRPLLRLLLVPGMHSAAAARLLEAFGDDPGRVLSAPRDDLARVAGVGPTLAATVKDAPGPAAAAREEARAGDLGLALVGPGDEGWPTPLGDLHDPPPLLWVDGGWVRRDVLSVAIVGSRKAQDPDRALAEHLARGLAARGVMIASGLAVGIDAAAHRGALRAPRGRTVAVLGCGHSHPYPRSTFPLRERIAARGAVLSDLPLDTRPQPAAYPRRNRIIAGLGWGTVVVRAADQSGSLGTADRALEIGRVVMGVPGRVGDPLSVGVHRLLRQGAGPVEEAEHVIELLGVELPPAELPGRPLPESGPGRAIWDALDGRSLLDSDALVRATGLPAGVVRAALVELEIEGLVRAHDGGRFARD